MSSIELVRNSRNMNKNTRQNTNRKKNAPTDANTGDPKISTPKPKVENENKTRPARRVAKTTENKTQNPSTKMEVQHHPQLEHKPKPWKEYLLEGFMIFIAVMMGFIAENIREDITNNQHVKQLTLQLVQDLKADTIKLDTIFANETKIMNAHDSLFVLLQQPLAKIDTKKLQLFAKLSHDIWLFYPSTGATGAIKNELHLKRFSDSEIIGHIAKFEQHIDLLHTVQDITLQYQRSFLDPFLYEHFTPANLDNVFNHHVSLVDAQMRNLTQQDLTRLAAQVVLIRINNNELIRDNRLLKSDAVNLLRYVARQYDIKSN
jgi:hypothetical protein